MFELSPTALWNLLRFLGFFSDDSALSRGWGVVPFPSGAPIAGGRGLEGSRGVVGDRDFLSWKSRDGLVLASQARLSP